MRKRPGRPEDIKAVPVRRPGRWIAAAIVLVIAASIIRSIVSGAGAKGVPNSGFQWHIVGQYLFDSRILHGVWATIYMTFLSMVIGILLGVIAAVMRMSPNPIVSGRELVLHLVLPRDARSSSRSCSGTTSRRCSR